VLTEEMEKQGEKLLEPLEAFWRVLMGTA